MVSDICDANMITQSFGCVPNPNEWQGAGCGQGLHMGIDLGYSDGGNAHLGSPILSPRNGEVVAIGPFCSVCPGAPQYLGPYAPVVKTDAEGVFVELGHVQAVHVAVGDRVQAGQHIADLGTLGASTGGHLHLEVRTDSAIQGPPYAAAIDPTPWLHYLPQEVDELSTADDIWQWVTTNADPLLRDIQRRTTDLQQWRDQNGDPLLRDLQRRDTALQTELDAVKARLDAISKQLGTG